MDHVPRRRQNSQRVPLGFSIPSFQFTNRSSADCEARHPVYLYKQIVHRPAFSCSEMLQDLPQIFSAFVGNQANCFNGHNISWLYVYCITRWIKIACLTLVILYAICYIEINHFEIAIKRCQMSTCLIELIKPYIESINLEEVAAHLKVGVGDILKSEFWAFALWFKVSGRGGVLVSPRKMSFWLVAIKKAIQACLDLESIEKLKTALEVEFLRVGIRSKQQQIYSEPVVAQLRQLVTQRFRQIEIETAACRQAQALTESYKPIIKQCGDQESLDAVAQLIRKNNSFFAPFPHLLQQLRQVWARRRSEIGGKGGLISQITVGAGYLP